MRDSWVCGADCGCGCKGKHLPRPATRHLHCQTEQSLHMDNGRVFGLRCRKVDIDIHIYSEVSLQTLPSQYINREK